jgi:DNA-binding Xre family transcriptional regulator
MSLRALAIGAGVSYVTVHRMASNKTVGVELKTLGKLARVLGVSPGDLIVSA